METRLAQCAVCGAEIDLLTNRCPYCSPEDTGGEAPAAPPVREPAGGSPVPPLETPPAAPREAPRAAPAPAEDREFGLLLFEAEESLARGAADKALVLASRAVKERPESLTARALLDRARRELLRGRRREKLEARVLKARALLEEGEIAEAERIVTSALKLIPDHAMALDLFARLKERRLGAGTVEAEAERELEALAHAQAARALGLARSAFAAGRIVEALVAARRGLRHVPDDPGLLALLKELQQATETLERERSRRNALVAQVRAGLELLEQGRLDESLKILRAVLREDPDNPRAQAAVLEVRQAFLASRSPAAERPAQAGSPLPEPRLRPVPGPPPPKTPSPPPREPPPPARSPRSSERERRAAEGPRSAIPMEILLPRTRRRATPVGLILAGGLLVLALVSLVVGRGGSLLPRSSAGRPAPAAVDGPAAAAPQAEPAGETGPLAGLDPDLRRAVATTLGAYQRALEAVDPGLLAQARPDLSAAERDRRLAPFVGALNATTDIRVLDAGVEGDEASVSILCTDVIVGGRSVNRPPSEETLRFERKDGAWALRAATGG